MTANVIAFVGLLGYLYGADDLYQVGPFETIALHTAVLILLLGTSAQLQGARTGCCPGSSPATTPARCCCAA